MRALDNSAPKVCCRKIGKEKKMLVTEELHATRSPASIERAAQIQLARSGYRSLLAITCHFRDNTLILRGDVPSYFHKQVAQEAIRKVRSVESIANEIVVSSSRDLES